MNLPLLSATRRTPHLVNRSDELQQIQEAIYKATKDSCQIVLIKGKGGIGKSRLAEETLWRGGNWRARDTRGPVPAKHPDWDWTQEGDAVIGNLIDMATTRYYTRVEFMQAIRDALVWPASGIEFPHYDVAYKRFQSQRKYMGDFEAIHDLEKRTEEAFIQDFQTNAQEHRLVLILDTVERLFPIGGTEWLLQHNLLTPEDMAFYTYQWLLDHIRGGTFINTTLFMAGREEEGAAFFEAIEEVADKNLNTIEIGPFSLDDTKTFLTELAKHPRLGESDQLQSSDITETIQNIAQNDARVKTLWAYTGGQPVRLSLYVDLIIEAQSIPDRLQDDPEFAERAKQEDTLSEIQEEIEASFIRLLFARPSLNGEILKALVRAPRGLDTDQLHYALFSKPEQTPHIWLERNREELEAQKTNRQILETLDALKNLSIVKIRPDDRIGLQDEIYRIYTHHLNKSQKSRRAEHAARQKLYTKLEDWAHFRHGKLLTQLTEIQAVDERKLNLTTPSRAYDEVQFSKLTEWERDKRNKMRAEMEKWELESLHYTLLRDFVKNSNHVAFEQADQKHIANNPGGEARIQAELWQVLKDPAYALDAFGGLQPWWSLRKRGEETLVALERVALQEDITNWIKRFVLRKQYQRALAFYHKLEDTLRSEFPADSEKHEERSWHHTLSRSQRNLWRDYARLLSSKETGKTLQGMEKAVGELEKLIQFPQNEYAFEDRKERGFHGHPAEEKIKRLVALYYNYIGYGYAQQGSFRKATRYYGKALSFMRETDFPHMVPTTANNLSRVLSDRGFNRARRICLDALQLRKEQGAEVPIAYSYNTLALIDNDHNRPDLAWVEAAIAIAYFRLANDPRGLGLSLLQLGEALRRMAKATNELYHLRGDRPELLLEIAGQTLDEAVNIFVQSEERIRRAEAWIERGCLERDYILWSPETRRRERHYSDALNYLDQATQLAQQINNKRLELDALVNMGWTHYYTSDFEEAAKALNQAEALTPEDSRIHEEGPLPSPHRDDLYNYQQLSKLNGLRGRMAMDTFKKRVKEINAQYPNDLQKRREAVREDSEAKKQMKLAAKHFTLALAYAQLLSPRSSALSLIYNSLYSYLKGFNLSEMHGFSNFALEMRQRYEIDNLKMTDLGKLHEFLTDSFGVAKEPSHD